MQPDAQLGGSVLFALILSVVMLVAGLYNLFFHDRKHVELDQWIDYGFSGATLRHVLIYYRFMGISMVVFYVLFVISCLMLQAEGALLFQDGPGKTGQPVEASPIGIMMFALDLVLRGGFFDVMEHFELSITTLFMKKGGYWFVIYCFIFRVYYGMSLIRIAISFAWLWVKIYSVRKTLPEQAEEWPAESSRSQPTRKS